MDEDDPDGLRPRRGRSRRCAATSTTASTSSASSRGRSRATPASRAVIPSMGTPSAPFLDFAGEIRRGVDIPVMHASRISDVATARHAIRDGLLDLVGHDPRPDRRPAPGRQGRAPATRTGSGPASAPTTASTRSTSPGTPSASTTRRPGASRRCATSSPPAPARRRVVVVGAGPAGLEAARVLGERGHDVVVLEAADLPGGQVRLAAAAARRRDLIGIVDWRVSEAKHSGVEFRYGVFADADLVLRRGPGRGGRGHRRACPTAPSCRTGADLVTDTWDVMGGALRTRRGAVAGLRRQRRRAGARRRRDAGRSAGAEVELVTPGADGRPRRRQHELAGLPARLRRARRHGDRRPRGSPAVRRGEGGGLVATLPQRLRRRSRSSAASTTSSSSTARCPTTTSTSTSCRTRSTAARSTTLRCSPCGRRRSSPNPDGRVPAVPDRRRRRQPQHPRRRSTTRCVCASAI